LIPAVHVTPDNEIGDAKVIDTRAGRVVATMNMSDYTCSHPLISPDERYLVLSDCTGGVSIWDIQQETLLRRLQVADGFAAYLAYSPDGHFLMASSSDGTVTIWPAGEGLANGVVLNAGADAQDLVVAAFRPDGRHIVTFGAQGPPLLWDIEPRGLLQRACDVVGRDLTQEEWDAVVPDRPYEPTCTAS